MQRFEIRMEPNEAEPLYYFTIVSKSGDILARSVLYPTKQAVENRINLIKENAAFSKVVDNTTVEVE